MKIIGFCFAGLALLILSGCSGDPSTIDLVCREMNYDGGIRVDKCSTRYDSISCRSKFKCYTFETGTRQLDFKSY